MKDISLNLEINLKKFSSLTLAEALWGSKIIQDDIKKFATTVFDKDGDDRENEKKWRNNIVQKTLNLLESLQIPAELFLKVQSTVVFTGEKVFNWFTSFTKIMIPYPFEKLYLPKIYWTQHGVIDDCKDYHAKKINPIGPMRFLNPPYCDLPGLEIHQLQPYAIACCYADENFIRELLPKISKLIKKVLGIKIKDLTRFKVNSAMTILLAWYKTVMNKDFDFNSVYSNLKSKDYPTGADKMFLHCLDMGVKKGAEYFYRRLKETDRQSIVQQAVLECLSETFLNGQVVLHDSLTEKTPEMLLYLLGKMTSERKMIFLTDKVAEVYTCFLYFWPYQELCTPLLDYTWVNIQKLNRLRLLQANLTILKHMSGVKHYAFTSDIYQPLVKDLLQRLPYDIKRCIWLSGNAIFNLFKIPDFLSIDVILENGDCKNMRGDIIDISKFLPDWILKQGGHTENIKNYIAHLKMSDDEKKRVVKFSKDPELLKSLIKSGRFEEAEDVLVWQCGSNQKEMVKLKNEIKKNPVATCSDFIKSGKFDLIEKYFKWIYDEKELECMKKEILSTTFIRDQFWVVWVTNRKESLKSAQKKSLKYLKYFFKTDDKINSFKKDKIIKDEGIVLSVLTAAKNMDYYANLSINFDEIVEFCSVPTDKVNEIKEKIFQKIVWYFPFIKETEQFLMLNSLVNWLNDDVKKSILKLLCFNDTQVVALLLISCKLAAYSEALKEQKKILILDWIKPYGDIEKLKKVLDKAKGVTEKLTENDIQKAKDLLDLCEISSERSLLRDLEQGLL